MSRIRSRRTRSEMLLHGWLKGNRVKHRMWPRFLSVGGIIEGDVLIGGRVVFVHGCFWHGCRSHFRCPKTNSEFWAEKIRRNRERHSRNARTLRRMGYEVVVVWEHGLKGVRDMAKVV